MNITINLLFNIDFCIMVFTAKIFKKPESALLHCKKQRSYHKQAISYELNAYLSCVTNSYYFSYNPSKNTLAKHKILQRLKRNKCCKGLINVGQRSFNVKGKLRFVKDQTKLQKLKGDPWPTKIHGHICRILKGKIKRPVFRKLSVMNL